MEYNTEKEFLQPILDYGMEGSSEVLQNLFNLALTGSDAAVKTAVHRQMSVRTTLQIALAVKNTIYQKLLSKLQIHVQYICKLLVSIRVCQLFH